MRYYSPTGRCVVSATSKSASIPSSSPVAFQDSYTSTRARKPSRSASACIWTRPTTSGPPTVGLCAGKGGSMHIADLQRGMLGANAIVGGSPPLVIGAALTAKTLKSDRVAVAFTGDGGSNQGTIFEAMNMAVVLQLPAIFVIENNGYGEGTAAEYAVGAKDAARRAAGFGMPAVKVDGRDFFPVYEAMADAVTRARAGGGPSFIEARCARIHGHYCGDPQTYRSKEELTQAREVHDPIVGFRRRVLASGELTASELDSIDRLSAEEMDAAVTAAHAGTAPPLQALYTDVYATY